MATDNFGNDLVQGTLNDWLVALNEYMAERGIVCYDWEEVEEEEFLPIEED